MYDEKTALRIIFWLTLINSPELKPLLHTLHMVIEHILCDWAQH